LNGYTKTRNHWENTPKSEKKQSSETKRTANIKIQAKSEKKQSSETKRTANIKIQAR